MQTIATLTMNPTIDKSSSVDHVVSGRKLRCKPPRHEPGGGGINVSRAILKLGGESTTLYPAGGPTGQMLQHLLTEEGLKHHPISIKEWTRENLTILEEATDHQYRFGMPGPPMNTEEWQQCLAALAALKPAPDYLVASGSLPPGVPADFYARVVRAMRDIRARVIVDGSGEPVRLAAREGVYLLKPNMREFQQLVGQEVTDEADIEAAAREIIGRGQSKVIVVSLGAAGAVIVSKEACEFLRSPTVPIKSRVGAGDSMVAGIVLSLARGKTLHEAVRFGVAAGAAAVMTPGTELCRREDAERLYARMMASSQTQ
jgi:6-phosphofructokinase 2